MPVSDANPVPVFYATGTAFYCTRGGRLERTGRRFCF